MKATLDYTFATAVIIVFIWFMMLQSFAKYSVSRIAAFQIIDLSKEVSGSRSQTEQNFSG